MHYNEILSCYSSLNVFENHTYTHIHGWRQLTVMSFCERAKRASKNIFLHESYSFWMRIDLFLIFYIIISVVLAGRIKSSRGPQFKNRGTRCSTWRVSYFAFLRDRGFNEKIIQIFKGNVKCHDYIICKAKCHIDHLVS